VESTSSKDDVGSPSRERDVSAELRQAASLVKSQACLILGQIYLIWLLLTSRATFSQLMLMNCAELLLASFLAALAFSRDWSIFFRRMREICIMAMICACLLLVFGVVELSSGGGQQGGDFDSWLRMMDALVSAGDVRYGLLYVCITVGGWLLLALTSGNARHWWVMNVTSQTSATFAAMLLIWVVALLAMMATGAVFGYLNPGPQSAATVHWLETVALLIGFCVARVMGNWSIQTRFTSDDLRKIEAKYFPDRTEG